MRRIGLAGAASAQLVDGVVHLRPEEAMVEAMLQGWRAQQTARGLRAKTIDTRERLVGRFLAFTNEFPWQWSPSHVDEWTMALTAEHHLAPATVADIRPSCGCSVSTSLTPATAGRRRVRRRSEPSRHLSATSGTPSRT